MAGQRTPQSREERLAGFTLLELTVALAIVSAVVAAAFNLQHQSFRAFQSTHQLTQAVLIAQEKLAEIQLNPKASGRRGQVLTPSGEELIWEVAVSTSPYEGVRNVVVRILPQNRSSAILEIATLVASP